MSKIMNAKTLSIFILALLFSAVIYGFAAANVVPESGAGAGNGTISGYTVTNIDYTLNGTTPTNLDAVEFDIAPTGGAAAAAVVEIKLVSTGSDWYSCSLAAGHATCATTSPQATVATADQLDVVATE